MMNAPSILRSRNAAIMSWNNDGASVNSSPCAEDSGAAATLLERGQHLTGRGTHAAPQAKRLRGLLHQHAPALQRTRAPLPLGPLEEGGRGLAVGQVVADRVRSDDRGREGRQVAS